VEVLHLRVTKSWLMSKTWLLLITCILSSKIVCNGMRGVSGTFRSRSYGPILTCGNIGSLTICCERSDLYDVAAVGCDMSPFRVWERIAPAKTLSPTGQRSDPSRAPHRYFSPAHRRAAKFIYQSITAPVQVCFSRFLSSCILT